MNISAIKFVKNEINNMKDYVNMYCRTEKLKISDISDLKIDGNYYFNCSLVKEDGKKLSGYISLYDLNKDVILKCDDEKIKNLFTTNVGSKHLISYIIGNEASLIKD